MVQGVALSSGDRMQGVALSGVTKWVTKWCEVRGYGQRWVGSMGRGWRGWRGSRRFEGLWPLTAADANWSSRELPQNAWRHTRAGSNRRAACARMIARASRNSSLQSSSLAVPASLLLVSVA